jgi:hypothetical protein
MHSDDICNSAIPLAARLQWRQWDVGKNGKLSDSSLALRRFDLAHVLQFIVHNSSSI